MPEDRPWRTNTTATTLAAFVRLGRPLFLAGGFVLYALGAAVAWALAAAAARGTNGAAASLDVGAYLLGQATITAFQLMTHYANDYFDLAADRANATPTRWSGGSRVLADGTLPPGVALAAARALGIAGLALAAAIFFRAGPAAAALALAAGGLAWAYSAPPLRLCARGLGELTTAAVVTGLTPLLGYVMQGGRPSALPLLAALPLCGLQFAMLLAIEFPDAAGDAAAGKRTLVVRLGAPAAAALYRALLVAVYGAIPILVAAGGLPRAAGLGLSVSAPIAAWQFWRLGRGAWRQPARWESLTFWAVAMLISSAAAELAAFVWLARWFV